MPDLSFQVVKAEAVKYAASPLLAFKLQVSQTGNRAAIHTAILRCQIRIEPAKRLYSDEEQDRLADLFDSPDRWSRTLRPMLWTHAMVVLPGFIEHVDVDLPVPCTFDFNVGSTKYFASLEDGEVPLVLLFSGTIFYEGDDGALQVEQIPWEKEAAFRLPVRVWEEMMEHYYPNTACLYLRRDAFDRLAEYKRQHRLPTWEQAVESLLLANVEA